MLLVEGAVLVGQVHQLLGALLEELPPHVHAEQQGDLGAVVVVGPQDVDAPRDGLKAAAVVLQLELHHLVQDVVGGFRLVEHQHEELVHLHKEGDKLEGPLVAHDQGLVRVFLALLLEGIVVEPIGVGEGVALLHVLDGLHAV